MRRGVLVTAAVAVVLALVVLWFRSPRPRPVPPGSVAAPSSTAADPPLDALVAPGAIEGIVLAGGGPARGARVAIVGARTRRIVVADEAGRFTAAELPPGTYDVGATMPAGARALLRAVPVDEAAVARVELRVAPLEGGVTLSGTVRDVLGGPVGGAEVWIGGASVVSTSADGSFGARVPVGEHAWLVRAAGYAESMATLDIGADLVIEIVLHPAASIRGTVVTADGRPAPHARVRALRRGGVEREATTDDAGRFELGELPTTTFDVDARTANGVARALEIVVVPTASREVTLTLDAAASVAGTVRSVVGGAPLPTADVELELDGERLEKTRTDANGRYRFVSVPRGLAVVRACAPGHACATSRTHLAAAAAPADIDVTLGSAGRLRLRVLDADDRPVKDASAYLADFKGCTSSADGTCVLDRAATRASTLRVRHATAGYLEEPIELGTGETERTVRLQAGATVRGTVRWDDGSAAARVVVLSGSTVARTDDRGTFELRNVCPGFLSVVAAPALALGERRYAQLEAPVHSPSLGRVSSGEVRTGVDIVLARQKETIAGTVRSPEGTPVAYASVGFAREDADAPWRSAHAGDGPLDMPSTYAGPDGAFTLDAVSSGTYAVWARSDEHPLGRVLGIAAGRQDVALTLPAAGFIEGTVQEEHGAPITDFVVHSRGRPMRVADARGHFRLAGLPARDHELVVESDPPSVRSQRQTVKVGVGETRRVLFTLPRALTVTGRVVTWPGLTPRANIELWVDGAGRRASAVTRADGTFELEGIPGGALSLSTMDADGEGEQWTRRLAPENGVANVGDLAFLPRRGYAHPFAFENDGIRALATGTGHTGGIPAEAGDEVVSLGGAPVATLSNASLAAACESLAAPGPIVVKKKGEASTVTTTCRPPRPAK